MAHRRTTIEEIAAKAGVSIATVSNVMNRKGRFSEHARARVLSAAEELRFTPNALIRSIQTRRTNVIGFRAWPYFAEMIDSSISMYLHQGVTDGLMEACYDELNYIDFIGRPQRDRALQFLDGRIDGLILGPGFLTEDELQILAESGLPVVMVYRSDCPNTMGAVSIDNAAGIDAAVRYLVDLGHHRVGAYFPGQAADMVERRQALAGAVIQYGLDSDPALFYDTANYIAPLETMVDWFINLPDRPEALIFGDDNVALKGIASLSARGIRVPEDVSVIGFDDAPSSRHGLGLTTIRQPARDVGRRAVEMLVRLIDGAPASECRVLLPVELQIRGSAAPAVRR